MNTDAVMKAVRAAHPNAHGYPARGKYYVRFPGVTVEIERWGTHMGEELYQAAAIPDSDGGLDLSWSPPVTAAGLAADVWAAAEPYVAGKH